MKACKRPRTPYVGACLVILVSGLLSRSDLLPSGGFLRAYGGDTLWATFVYVLLVTLFPSWPIMTTALGALLFSYAIELSQLYHAPWIDGIRNTRIGALILGHGFLWTDLVCYTAGVGMAVCLDAVIQRICSARHQQH